MKSKNIIEKIKIDSVKQYWSKNIPQQWYSSKEPYTLSWFNDIAKQRYNKYYKEIYKYAEFENHSGEKVLEIGVGMGTDLIQYAKNGSEVYGIDLAQEQIDLCKLHFKTLNIQYKNLKVSSGEDLPYEDKKFDLVYAFGVLHHTPNIEKCINEIHRVLKNDGEAIIMLYAKGWKHYFKRIFIQGILKGKLFKYKFDFQKLSNEISEVQGNSPLTNIYSKRKVKKIFSKFEQIRINKTRLGEFFEYRPYGTIKFPKIVENIFALFSLQELIGENYFIKVKKYKNKYTGSLFNVIFKHY